MSGKLSLEVKGREYELSGQHIAKLAESLNASLNGGIVSMRLDCDAKPASVVRSPTFRFLTKRGAERLSKPEQKQLLTLAEKVIAGESHCWPPKFTTSYLGSDSD